MGCSHRLQLRGLRNTPGLVSYSHGRSRCESGVNEFLSPSEVRRRSAEVREALAELRQTVAVVGRPSSKQWRLFEACASALLGEPVDGEPGSWSAPRLAQYRKEVMRRLRTHYGRYGRELAFAFRIEHRTRVLAALPPCYPDVGGYVLLVRDAQHAESPVPSAELVERRVADAIAAEFAAYRALPRVDEARLRAHFAGPALAQVMSTLQDRVRRGWTTGEPEWNPSTYRIQRLVIESLVGTRATVRTQEYVYLRWWSRASGRYTYPYRETTRQTYLLEHDGDRWRVRHNEYASPATSMPHRRRHRVPPPSEGGS